MLPDKEIMLAFDQQGEGPTIILLHGMGIAHRMWQPQIEALSKKFHVIAPDLPGFGSSPRRESFSLPRASQAVANLIERQSSGSAAHLCGLSLGGLVALQLAISHPQYVKSLFLASTSLATLKRGQQILTGLLLRLLPMKYIVHSIQHQSIPDHDFWEIAKEDLLGTGKHTLLEVIQLSVDLNVSLVTAPALVACGSEDRANLAPARLLAEQLPQARFEIVPEAHHVWNLEYPEVFNRMVVDFIGHLD